MSEIHPEVWQARLLRRCRSFRSLRGWRRVAAALLPTTSKGDFVVENESGFFAGSLSSYIDREIYLMGGYEAENIAAFLEFIPANRNGVALDIGANVGTHSIAFARRFHAVHSFEPNGRLWNQFSRNVSLNRLGNVRLHRFGLGCENGSTPFYITEKDNFGLGTASSIEQYDVPLVPLDNVEIRIGDEIVEREIDCAIDAIKIDVQGFEAEVVAGLSRTIRNHRPVVWVEVGPGTATRMSDIAVWTDLFGGDVDIFRFEPRTGLLNHEVTLDRFTKQNLEFGDYVFVPGD